MTRAGRIAAACIWLCAVLAATALAETEQLRATADTPATLTARPMPAAADNAPRKGRLVISVTSYRPADDCTPVEIVVDGHKGDGAMHEIGRFAVTPAADFDAREPAQALRFNLPLPDGLRTAEAIHLTVRLELRKQATPPAAACGRAKPGALSATDRDKGPYVQIGSAQIR